MELKPGQIWKHYKGNEYEILILGKHSETAEEMVVYKQVESGAVYIRPLDLFFSEAQWEGAAVPRFTFVSDN